MCCVASLVSRIRSEDSFGTPSAGPAAWSVRFAIEWSVLVLDLRLGWQECIELICHDSFRACIHQSMHVPKRPVGAAQTREAAAPAVYSCLDLR